SKSALHVRRKLESADGVANDAGGDAAVSGAALAIAACLAKPRAGTESGDDIDAVRSEGAAEEGDPRCQPRGFLLRQVDVHAEWACAGYGLPDSVCHVR